MVTGLGTPPFASSWGLEGGGGKEPPGKGWGLPQGCGGDFGAPPAAGTFWPKVWARHIGTTEQRLHTPPTSIPSPGCSEVPNLRITPRPAPLTSFGAVSPPRPLPQARFGEEEEEEGMKAAGMGGKDAHLPAGASLRRQPPGVGSATHVCGEGGVGTRVYTVYIYHRGTGAGGVTDQRSRQPTAHPQVGNPLPIFHPSWGGLAAFFSVRGRSTRLRFTERDSLPC